MKAFIFFILLFASVFGVFAQSVEPEDPEIVLPEIALELESSQQETVETIVPDDVALFEPELEPILPQAEDLNISFDILDLPLLDQETPEVVQENSFYTEGTLGLGTTNRFLSDFTLYKFGMEPRFNIHFNHDILDGYNFGFNYRPAGEGFFKRNDLLEIQLTYNDLGFKIETDFDYLERETGLQGFGDFYSIIRRKYSADVLASFSAAKNLALEAKLDFDYMNFDLSSSEFSEGSELKAVPSFGAKLADDNGYFRSDVFYTLYYMVDALPLHGLKLLVDGGYEFNNGLGIAGSAGISWFYNSDILFPFDLTFKWVLSENALISLKGGFSESIPAFLEKSKEIPYLYSTAIPLREKEWFGQLDGRFKISELLTSDVFADFSYITDHNIPDFSAQDPATALFGMTGGNGIYLRAGLDTEWKLSEDLLLKVGWKSQVLPDLDPYFPAHELNFNALFNTSDEKFKLKFNALWQIDERTNIPEIGLSLGYEIVDGVFLELDGADILAPLYPEGRVKYGTFIEPGASATIKTQISL